MIARPVRLLSGVLTVGVWTMASRVLGFIRDILIAALLGAGPVAEAFFVAFRLPNMFRRFFAEGAFNTAFVPMFARRLSGQGPETAQRFAEDALAGLATVLLILTLIAQAGMPWLVFALASGFENDPAQFDLTVTFSRIVFPYILFISLAALFAGVLNALGRFAAAAAAPVLLNVILISGMVAATAAGWSVGPVLAWAASLAGVAQLVLVAVAAHKAGMRIQLRRPRWTGEMRDLVRLGLPAAIAGGVLQINLLVGTQVASHFDGAVAWLWLADRIYQLPLGVVGIAIGVVLLPDLARRLGAGDDTGARTAFSRAGEFALILTLPATAALIAMPTLVTSVLYERGAFTPTDTAATADALLIYALGLPAFILQKVVSPVYFAHEDTRTPLRYALVAMVLNAVVAIALAPIIGFLAAALAATLAGWVNVAQLWFGARKFGDAARPDARLMSRWPKIVLSTAAMAVVVVALDHLFAGQGLNRIVALGLVIAAGFVSYAGMAVMSGAFVPSDLRDAMRRQRES